MDSRIADELSRNFEIDLHEKRSFEELKLALTNYVNYLIHHDINKLMGLLYRVDVSEKILKENLQKTDSDPASTIAEMIIERQIGKMKSRNQHKISDDDIPDNEKW